MPGGWRRRSPAWRPPRRARLPGRPRGPRADWLWRRAEVTPLSRARAPGKPRVSAGRRRAAPVSWSSVGAELEVGARSGSPGGRARALHRAPPLRRERPESGRLTLKPGPRGALEARRCGGERGPDWPPRDLPRPGQPSGLRRWSEPSPCRGLRGSSRDAGRRAALSSPGTCPSARKAPAWLRPCGLFPWVGARRPRVPWGRGAGRRAPREQGAVGGALGGTRSAPQVPPPSLETGKHPLSVTCRVGPTGRLCERPAGSGPAGGGQRRPRGPSRAQGHPRGHPLPCSRPGGARP